MSRFALAITPYGNFAVQAAEARGHATLEAFRLTPIGDLTEIPTRDLAGVPAVDALDWQTVDGATFTVNRVDYHGTLTVSRVQYHGQDVAHTFVSGALAELTSSAQDKLAAWWDANAAHIITPEFRALTALAAARIEQSHRARAQQSAAAELAIADAKLEAAGDAVLEALTALHALNIGHQS